MTINGNHDESPKRKHNKILSGVNRYSGIQTHTISYTETPKDTTKYERVQERYFGNFP